MPNNQVGCTIHDLEKAELRYAPLKETETPIPLSRPFNPVTAATGPRYPSVNF